MACANSRIMHQLGSEEKGILSGCKTSNKTSSKTFNSRNIHQWGSEEDGILSVCLSCSIVLVVYKQYTLVKMSRRQCLLWEHIVCQKYAPVVVRRRQNSICVFIMARYAIRRTGTLLPQRHTTKYNMEDQIRKRFFGEEDGMSRVYRRCLHE